MDLLNYLELSDCIGARWKIDEFRAGSPSTSGNSGGSENCGKERFLDY